MKKIILISGLLAMTIIGAAQSNIRLNLYSAYVLDDDFSVDNDANTYFRGKVKGGYQWGGGFEFAYAPHYSVELLYLNKHSDVPATFKAGGASPVRSETFDVSDNYIMLAGNFLRPGASGKVEAYGGLMGGVLITDLKSPSTGQSDSHSSFAWGARVGANIWASQRIGFKLQAQLLSSPKATGGDLYFSYWGPVVLDTYTTLWQFGVGGGLTFRLGH